MRLWLCAELDAADQCSKRAAVAYLRQFDLAGQFGPCANVLRSHRYRRAVDLGLRPPLSVDVVLGRFLPDDPSVDQWFPLYRCFFFFLLSFRYQPSTGSQSQYVAVFHFATMRGSMKGFTGRWKLG